MSTSTSTRSPFTVTRVRLTITPRR
jgi:hypothetical protein